MPLFAGNGYSDDFSVNMQKIKNQLEEENLTVTLVSGCDDVCQNCPNREGGFCITDGEKNQNVINKDKHISEIIGLEENFETDYYGGLKAVKAAVDEQTFAGFCEKCSWKSLGLCSYAQWLNAVEKFI